MRLPKCRPNVYNFFALVSPFSVMTMAKPCLFLFNCAFLSQSLFVNQHRNVFSCISEDNLTSCFNSSIFSSPRYLSKGIPYIFNLCQCFKIFTPTIAWSTVITDWISKFDSCKINNLAFACSISRANIAPDGTDFT